MTKIEVEVAEATTRTWEQPELRRIEATDAEAVGATGDDGVIGASS